MDDTNKSLLLDINFRTELLESLDWDESQFDSLFIFLQENFQSNKVGPKELLEQIKVKYGENTSKLLLDLVKNIYIENGLYITREEDNEH